MKTIDATRFRVECLALLDDLDEDGIVIAKRGKPVARGQPDPIGSLRHKVEVRGDIFSTGVDWDAGRES